ncbi:hypothetical protein [Ferruginibacter sp.]
MKRFLPVILLLLSFAAKAQQIDSIYVHLYTDSLKKGTYNYINIDGLLHNGRYLPLDTSNIKFSSSGGKFFGNNLFIENDFAPERVSIKAVLKSNPALYKEFIIYIKKKPDDENLRTVDEIMNSATPSTRQKKRKG